MKIIVEIDSDIDGHKASEQELRRRYKSVGPMKIVTERGLQVLLNYACSSQFIFISKDLLSLNYYLIKSKITIILTELSSTMQLDLTLFDSSCLYIFTQLLI